LPGAGLAGTVRAVRLLLRPATAGPGSPGQAGSLTGALLPRPARWLCLQQHDTASDKGLSLPRARICERAVAALAGV